MDRVDKVLLLLPLLPLMDLASTLFSLRFGGKEIGILAGPILERYGPAGLALLAASASVLFLTFMGVVIRIKGEFAAAWISDRKWYVLAIPIYWFFVLEGIYVSTVVMNLLVPLAPALTQITVLRAILVGAFVASASVSTLPQMKPLSSI